MQNFRLTWAGIEEPASPTCVELRMMKLEETLAIKLSGFEMVYFFFFFLLFVVFNEVFLNELLHQTRHADRTKWCSSLRGRAGPAAGPELTFFTPEPPPPVPRVFLVYDR